MSETTQATQSQVPQWLAHLTAQIENVEEFKAKIDARLSPVIKRPDISEDKKVTEKDAIQLVPLASELRELTNRLKGLLLEFEQMLSRIEL